MMEQTVASGAATIDFDDMLSTLERIEGEIAGLKEQITNARTAVKPRTGVRSIREFGFCGMWKDREDMKGLTSSEWLARLRSQQWRRFAHGG